MSFPTLTATWSDPVTLTQDEIFQCHKGTVYLTLADAAPADTSDGIRLADGDSFIAPGGATVRFNSPVPTQARLYRGVAQ